MNLRTGPTRLDEIGKQAASAEVLVDASAPVGGAVHVGRGASLPDVPAAPSAPSSRGRCPVCGYSFALRKDGTTMGHLLYLPGTRLPCKGGGRPPVANRSDAVWESPRGW